MQKKFKPNLELIMKKIVSLVIPPYLVGVKNRSSYIRTVVTRIALNNFNAEAYKLAQAIPASQCEVTSVTLNEVGLRGLLAYQEKHGLSSRNQAVLAILATYHADQPVVNVVPKLPSFASALAMIGGHGSRVNLTNLVMREI